MLNKINAWLRYIILFCYLCFSLYWFFIVSSYNFLKCILYIGVIGLIFVMLYLLFRKIKIKLNRNICIILGIVISLLLRGVLLKLSYGDLFSDYETFYNNALFIATGEGALSYRYISIFPYLYGYIFVLGKFLYFFGTNYINVVMMNIIIDLLGAIFIYLFVRNINRKSAVYALMLWLFNPFNIYFSVFCSLVIIVNTLIAITLYISSLFIINLDGKRYLFYSILLGILIAITNIFRPIMIIFIIAMLIYILYLFFEKNSIRKRHLIFSMLIIGMIYYGGNNFYFKIMSNVTGYNITGSMSGWSIYVGSNYDVYGQWSISNTDTYNKYYNVDDFEPKKFNDSMMKLGLDRYRSNGIKNNLILLKNKSKVLAASVNDYNVNSFRDFNTDNNTLLDIFVQKYTDLFWYFLIVANLLFVVLFYKMEKSEFNKVFMYCLYIIGFCLSSLLLEVSPRYFYPIFPLMIFVSAISFGNIVNFLKVRKLKND